MIYHFGTNDGTVPWCAASPFSEQKRWGEATYSGRILVYGFEQWCPECLDVWKHLKKNPFKPRYIHPIFNTTPTCSGAGTISIEKRPTDPDDA